MNADKDFNITETVNRTVEKNQFPHYRNHKSLIGNLLGFNFAKLRVVFNELSEGVVEPHTNAEKTCFSRARTT